jgi:hypothetical protein
MDRTFVFPLAAATMKGVDDALDHMACEECGSALVALLSDGTALCACCAAIRWRIPSADPLVVKAEVRRRIGTLPPERTDRCSIRPPGGSERPQPLMRGSGRAEMPPRGPARQGRRSSGGKHWRPVAACQSSSGLSC